MLQQNAPYSHVLPQIVRECHEVPEPRRHHDLDRCSSLRYGLLHGRLTVFPEPEILKKLCVLPADSPYRIGQVSGLCGIHWYSLMPRSFHPLFRVWDARPLPPTPS